MFIQVKIYRNYVLNFIKKLKYIYMKVEVKKDYKIQGLGLKIGIYKLSLAIMTL